MTTIWLKAHDLLKEHGWTKGIEESRDGCMCAGGGIAKAITGSAYDMYFDYKLPEVAAALEKFAEHVGASTVGSDGDLLMWPCERVTDWNDGLDDDGQEDVLKALMELHEAEVAAANA